MTIFKGPWKRRTSPRDPEVMAAELRALGITAETWDGTPIEPDMKGSKADKSKSVGPFSPRIKVMRRQRSRTRSTIGKPASRR